MASQELVVDTTPMDELQQLKELNEYQQKLTRMLVHDLKTPLSNILSLTEGHLEESKSKQIYEASQHMLRLTLDMLEVQKMKHLYFQPTLLPQNLPNLIEGAIHQVLGIARNKNISITLEGAVDDVLADDQLTQRTLINLLDNAIKFSPQNSNISIQIDQESKDSSTPSFAKISITDQGVGIPLNEQSKIFDQFYQVQSPQAQQGTGLGLSFCKMAIEAQGGKIGLSSALKQQGNSFWFTLPTHPQTSIASTTMTSYTTTRKTLVLTPEDRHSLEPWKAKLRQYEVYQLSKIKAILKTMAFAQDSNCFQWKLDIEQALYATNQAKYSQLLH
ncbi:hypothetical protein BKI52_35895 [marine bacterium AO1-C]|nr:hypothetical protein BKI52_35895 [marine bacterium AO1-C]